MPRHISNPLIAGESGSGKTSIIRAFSGGLNNSLYKVVYFPLSTVSPNDFYRGLLYGLGEIPKTKKIDMFGQIQASILTLYKNQKITPVIVLDEMHLASNALQCPFRPVFKRQKGCADSHAM